MDLHNKIHLSQVTYLPWSSKDYASQREKMVTGHVYVPVEHCKTEWFLKIDTDAIAHDPAPLWPDPTWFEPDGHGQYNVMIASSWGYTRAKGGGVLNDDLDAWCEELETFGDIYFKTSRIGLADLIGSRSHPKGPKMRMTRLASWICFQRTGWVRSIAKLFEERYGHHRLPVPSHDTSLWYAALRSGARFQFAKMTTHGWMNRLTMRSISEQVSKVLRDEDGS